MSTRKIFSRILPQAILLFGCLLAVKVSAQTPASMIGREVAIPRHLQDGDEYQLSIPQLIAFGEKLFTARWTVQEGAGRPLSKGTANGARLSDPSTPLVFPFNFNRLSGPDANSCSGCHNLPSTGGGGDRVANVLFSASVSISSPSITATVWRPRGLSTSAAASSPSRLLPTSARPSA